MVKRIFKESGHSSQGAVATPVRSVVTLSAAADFC